jgi:hypothetical protein
MRQEFEFKICDCCKAEEKRLKEPISYGLKLSKWISVQKQNEHGSVESFDFCSKDCVVKFFK